MIFVSTRDPTITASFHEALFQGIATDGGLYTPNQFPCLPEEPLTQTQSNSSLSQLASNLLTTYIDDVPENHLHDIIHRAFNFPIPLVPLDNNIYLLEVFHGPTLAFKDVGARFMANILAFYLAKEKRHLNILVATSGDTGSAIAHAFHGMAGIDVYILYPSHKITLLQELQMTTLGGNIHAIEVQGTFDDCQQMVKSALMDTELARRHPMSTANSINLARLLPQMVYHAWGVCQFQRLGKTIAPYLSVPSGNFGNLTSAIYAKSLGFPINRFIAATNANDIIPHYLNTGEFHPQSSRKTLSNAMDVGNPSNFERLTAFYHHDMQHMRKDIEGIAISDDETLTEIRYTYENTGYILDPHTAVGVAAARRFGQSPIIVTATAHPAKFPEAIQAAIGREADVPERLALMLAGKKQSIQLDNHYAAFRALLSHAMAR